MESLFGKDKKVEVYNFDLIEGLKEEDVLKVFFSNRGNDFLSINLIRDEIKSENSHFSKVELGEINKQIFPVIVNKGSDFEGKKLSRQRVDRGALSQLEVQFFLQPENEAIKNLADFYKDFLGEVDKSLVKDDEKIFSEIEIQDLTEKLKRNKASAFFLTFSVHQNNTSLRSALNDFASRGIDTSFILSLEKKLPDSHFYFVKANRYDANSNVISCLILTDTYGDEKKVAASEPVIKKLSELYPEIKNVIVFSLI